MCCRKNQLRVGLADHILKGEHTCVLQNISHLRVAPKVKAYNYKGLGRPRNTHVCPRKNKLRVARKDLGIKKYEGLAPTSCCCEHTHVCCRISKLRLHPRIRGLQGLGRPGAAASTHMFVSEKTPFIQGCTQGSKGCMGSADELLL